MKKLLFMLICAIVVCSASCKKDIIGKQAAPKAAETVKTTAAATTKAPYDYQKAIMAKRTLNPKLDK